MEKKDCFGILEKVFPVDERGLREVPPGCFQCPERTACLRSAMSTEEGLEMRGEIVDRAAGSGLLGRFQRWSHKKELDRLMKEQREKKR